MKKMLASGAVAAVLALSGPALAADMPVKVAPVAPVWTWTGFYIGAHGGGGWSDPSWTSDFNCAVGTLCDSGGSNISGWLAGGTFGYRWQFTNWVFGLEATLSAADINGTTGPSCTFGVNTCLTGAAGFTNIVYTTRLASQSTATAQLGFTWDHSLFYVKGGWAGGTVTRNSASHTATGAQIFSTGDLNQRSSGWTGGIGWEYLLTQNFSVGIEYDYVHLPVGALLTTAAPGGFTVNTSSTNLNVHEVVARINYRFGWPY